MHRYYFTLISDGFSNHPLYIYYLSTQAAGAVDGYSDDSPRSPDANAKIKFEVARRMAEKNGIPLTVESVERYFACNHIINNKLLTVEEFGDESSARRFATALARALVPQPDGRRWNERA